MASLWTSATTKAEARLGAPALGFALRWIVPTFAHRWIGAGPCHTKMPMDRSSVDMQDVGNLLAAERTLLAWIQTGIVCMAVGVLVARFGLFAREPTIASHGATTLTDTMIGIG